MNSTCSQNEIWDQFFGRIELIAIEALSICNLMALQQRNNAPTRFLYSCEKIILFTCEINPFSPRNGRYEWSGATSGSQWIVTLSAAIDMNCDSTRNCVKCCLVFETSEVSIPKINKRQCRRRYSNVLLQLNSIFRQRNFSFREIKIIWFIRQVDS